MNRNTFHELFPITSLLTVLVVGFFIIEVLAYRRMAGEVQGVLMGPGDEHARDILNTMFIQLGALETRLTTGGEVWRLLACAFLHGGLMHLFFNTVVLIDLGRFCEPLLSSPKFFTVYVLCALGGSVASLGSHLAMGTVGFSVGASGALAGLIGLMLVYAIKERHRDMRDMLVRWIIMIILITLIIPRVDHAAHAGGFVTGGLLGLTVEDYMTSRSAARWRFPSYAVGVVVALALGVGLVKLWTGGDSF